MFKKENFPEIYSFQRKRLGREFGFCFSSRKGMVNCVCFYKSEGGEFSEGKTKPGGSVSKSIEVNPSFSIYPIYSLKLPTALYFQLSYWIFSVICRYVEVQFSTLFYSLFPEVNVKKLRYKWKGTTFYLSASFYTYMFIFFLWYNSKTFFLCVLSWRC